LPLAALVLGEDRRLRGGDREYVQNRERGAAPDHQLVNGVDGKIVRNLCIDLRLADEQQGQHPAAEHELRDSELRLQRIGRSLRRCVGQI
jgi:hypothetical protein